MGRPLPGASDRRHAHPPARPEMATTGVLEDGIVTIEEKGRVRDRDFTAALEVYLHYVSTSGPSAGDGAEATGDMIMIRYADDLVVGFQHESDARRFWDAMRDRLREFSLSLHPG